MSVIRIAAAFACMFLLAGCLPVTSKTPVGTTAGLGADPALYGMWKGHNPEEKDQHDGIFHFLKAKDGGMTAAVIVANGESDDDWSIYNLRTATLGKNRFINAVLAFDNGASPDDALKNANIPMLYIVKGRTLTLYLIDEDKAKDAIKSGMLKGTIEPGDSGDVQITSEGAELDAFMATPEATGLFRVLLALKKMD